MRRYSNNMLKLPKAIRKQSLEKIFLAAVFVVFAVGATIVVNASLKPIIMKMAEQYGTAAVADTVNTAVNEVFENETIGYSDIVKLNYNSQGFVTSVEYDTLCVNKIRGLVSDTVTRDLSTLRASKIRIPLGSLSNDVTLSGKGPYLKVKIVQSSVPQISITSSFEAIGINTVKHDIIMRVTVRSEIYLPPKREEFCFTQDYCLAQTIIVGNIPSGYADIG